MTKMKNIRKQNIILVFIITFLFFCIWYSFLMPIVRCMVSSDEFLSIGIGVTSFTDLDWNGLIGKVERYYGGGYTILFTPLMYFVESAYLRYFIMHMLNAVLHAGVGVLCYIIYTDYLNRPDNLEAILVSLATSLFYFEGLEGTNVYNELPLYVTIWLTLFEILWLIRVNDNTKKKAFGTAILSLTLAYSLTLHTRAIFTIGSVVVTVVLVWIIYKKVIVNVVELLAFLVIGYLANECVGNYIRAGLWETNITQNTVEGAFGATGVFSKFSVLLSQEGISAFISTILGKLFGIIATSGGLFCIGIILCLFSLFKFFKFQGFKKSSENLYFNVSMLFIIVLNVSSFFLFGLNATNSVMDALANAEMTYWPFYLRYHFLYIIPLMPYVFASFSFSEILRKKISQISLAFFGVVNVLTLYLLHPLFTNCDVRYRTKIVYFPFLPFTLKHNSEIIGLEFLTCNIGISIILFIIHSLLYCKGKVKWSCVCSIVTSIYLFGYIMLNIFIPESNTIYYATDQIYKYLSDINFEDIGTNSIYYVGFTHLEAEVLQFELYDWKVLDGNEKVQISDDKCIIISNRILEAGELNQFCHSEVIMKEVDIAEYIYFIGIDEY